MFNELTTITLNNNTLGTRNITKSALEFFFAPFFYEYKNTTRHSYFTINCNRHICCIWILRQPACICLCKSVSKINEILCSISIKLPLIYLTSMQWSIHPWWNILGNKLIQTHEIQNNQVLFLYNFWQWSFGSNPEMYYHSW